MGIFLTEEESLYITSVLQKIGDFFFKLRDPLYIQVSFNKYGEIFWVVLIYILICFNKYGDFPTEEGPIIYTSVFK